MRERKKKEKEIERVKDRKKSEDYVFEPTFEDREAAKRAKNR